MQRLRPPMQPGDGIGQRDGGHYIDDEPDQTEAAGKRNPAHHPPIAAPRIGVGLGNPLAPNLHDTEAAYISRAHLLRTVEAWT